MASSLNSFSISHPDKADGVRIDTVQAKKAALILRAINHKLRQQMIKLIDDNKQMPVTQIYVKLRLEQSVASQHLAILRKADLVNTRREGKFIFYTVNYARVAEVMQFVDDLTKKA